MVLYCAAYRAHFGTQSECPTHLTITDAPLRTNSQRVLIGEVLESLDKPEVAITWAQVGARAANCATSNTC